jgi:nucleoid-associated protein YgaU
MYGEISRYKHSDVIRRDDNVLYLDTPPRVEYVGGYDEVLHRVVLGDTLWNLALRYYSSIEGAASLWWIIADFQPEPINDPTVALVPGSWLVIPSIGTVQEWLMANTEDQGPQL